MWNELGSSPSSDEFEITVFGPGYGESVVVHLGDGKWLIVDSCIDTSDPQRQPAPLQYLRGIGVRPELAVKFVVASHWDDDHVRGLSEIVKAAPAARFICSHVLPDEKFGSFVEALSIGSAATDGGNVRNIRQILEILEQRRSVIWKASPGRTICASPVIRTWSPSDYDANEFLLYVAQMHPRAGEPLRRPSLGTSNLTSIVLSIDWPKCSVLLGADMERHPDARRGWQAITSLAQELGWTKASYLKVPHHGSDTGHDDAMWRELLEREPTSVVAPFGRGPRHKRPPKSSDVRRISELSGSLYLTARQLDPPKTRMSVAVTRSLRDGAISFVSQKSPFGMVRSRSKDGSGWTHETFGLATRVK